MHQGRSHSESIGRFVPWISSMVMVLANGCSSNTSSSSGNSGYNCAALAGSSWVPQVPGVASSSHNSSVALNESFVTSSGPLVGLAEGYSSKVISVSVDMQQDLGQYGSLTLLGEVTGFPSKLGGSAFAYLVSLSDGTNEYVNLNSNCTSNGLYVCPTSSCTANTSCTVSWPSAFFDRDHWEQHQSPSYSGSNSPSVNIFPTCNWSGGLLPSPTLSPSWANYYNPPCAFNSGASTVGSGGFFVNGKLKSGVNYTAKYLLVLDSYKTNPGSYTAGLKVTAIKKTNTSGSPNSAFDMNFVLVGTNNIQASRTKKGQQNLNTLAASIANDYAQSNSNLKVGTVRAVEWTCDQGGDQYADAGLSELSSIFSQSGSLLPSAVGTQALNIFLVSTITDDSVYSNSNLTILGVDGAIGAPPKNGTATSGMLVSTFDLLDQYNVNCPSSAATCDVTQQDSSFFELGETVTHEMGHAFGLNHLSEYPGTYHDVVSDTPICTATETIGTTKYITINSCVNSTATTLKDDSGTAYNCRSSCSSYNADHGIFCPAATACEFNYVMWWTTKNFQEGVGTGDGNLFSPGQSAIMHYHPWVQ